MKKLFSFVFFILCTINLTAYDLEVDGIYYNFLGDDSVEVTNLDNYTLDYNEYSDTVIIPTTINFNDIMYRVTSIGDYAFDNCYTLTSVTIPNSIIRIGEGAFYYCSGLTEITIPNSVAQIGRAAFMGCAVSLNRIVVESNNKNYHSTENCLIETTSKTLIAGCKNSVIPSDGSVTSIGYSAFWECNTLTDVTIPNSVTEIAESAFSNSSISSISMGNSVTTIGNGAFQNCVKLTSLIFPNSVISIGDWAFSGCKGLLNIALPDSILSIGDEAFRVCSNLTSIAIPSSVKTIGRAAFAACSTIKSVVIPNSVTQIGEGAFSYCPNIETITVETDNSAYHSKGNCLIETTSKILHTGCKNSIIPTDGSITVIGNNAFAGCSYLATITIPNSVTSINYFSFYGCSSLTSIIIPNSVTTIGDYAFDGCSKITEITSLAPIPPTIQSRTFSVNRSTPIYVPKPSINAYKTANNWKNFTNIQTVVVPFSSLTLRVDKIALYPNEKYFLNTIVAPVEVDKSTLIWTTSDTEIVTVDSTGFVTAHTVGTANIIVSTPDYVLSDTCEVVVLDESQEPSDDVVVDPNDKSVEISWTPIDGAAYYVFVVYADENQVTKICTLTFNAWGFLTNIHFLPKKAAFEHENNPFNFTVTGLEENTTYGYSMSSYDEDETLITSKVGQFTTTSDVTTSVVKTLSHSVSNEVRKVLENGTIYILRDGKKYTIDGRLVE